MNLTKFMKGATTISELENLPNTYIQTIYKEYTEFMRDSKAQEGRQAEEVVEALGGG